MAISDIVLRRTLPEPVQRAMGLWTGCVAGALHETDYAKKLEQTGFERIEIEPTHVYDSADITRMAAGFISSAAIPDDLDVEATITELSGAVMSAFVRAVKPGRKSRSAP